MYPIISGKEGEYEAFGIGLVTDKDVPVFLKSIGKESLWYNKITPLLKRILEENTRDEIFAPDSRLVGTDIATWLDCDLHLKTLFCGYAAVAPRTSYCPIYDELLKKAPLYFDRGLPMPSIIYISYYLSIYLETFKALNFTLVRKTPKKQIVDIPHILPSWQGKDNEILIANTLALMLLTGQTSFWEDGKETPIILWDSLWQKVMWENITRSSSNNTHYDCVYKLIKKN
jgi:hypothetical protein